MGVKPEFNKIIRKSFIVYFIFAAAFPFIVTHLKISPEEMKLTVFLAVLATAGVFLFFWGWEVYGKQKMIEDIPTSKIRSIPMGIVEIKGKALQKYPLESKLNAVKCVYYKYKIEKLVASGFGRNRRSSWKVISQGQSITPFYVEDSTGKVLIEPFNCESVLKRKYYYSDGMFEGAKRYSEWYIEPGEELYVLGFAGKSEDVMASRRAKLCERLKELKKDKNAVSRYDLNKDGRIDEYEWGLIVNGIKRELARDDSGGDLCDVAVSGRKNDKMIISDESEKQLLKNLAVKSFAGIFGGLLLFALSAYFIAEKFANIWAR